MVSQERAPDHLAGRGNRERGWDGMHDHTDVLATQGKDDIVARGRRPRLRRKRGANELLHLQFACAEVQARPIQCLIHTKTAGGARFHATLCQHDNGIREGFKDSLSKVVDGIDFATTESSLPIEIVPETLVTRALVAFGQRHSRECNQADLAARKRQALGVLGMTDANVANSLGPVGIAVGQHNNYIAVPDGLQASLPAIEGAIGRRRVLVDPHLKDGTPQNFVSLNLLFQPTPGVTQFGRTLRREKVIATARQHDPDLSGATRWFARGLKACGTLQPKTLASTRFGNRRAGS